MDASKAGIITNIRLSIYLSIIKPGKHSNYTVYENKYPPARLVVLTIHEASGIQFRFSGY
jgi:hypothetical protein